MPNRRWRYFRFFKGSFDQREGALFDVVVCNFVFDDCLVVRTDRVVYSFLRWAEQICIVKIGESTENKKGYTWDNEHGNYQQKRVDRGFVVEKRMVLDSDHNERSERKFGNMKWGLQ